MKKINKIRNNKNNNIENVTYENCTKYNKKEKYS